MFKKKQTIKPKETRLKKKKWAQRKRRGGPKCILVQDIPLFNDDGRLLL